jgi:hypothetical protein
LLSSDDDDNKTATELQVVRQGVDSEMRENDKPNYKQAKVIEIELKT